MSERGIHRLKAGFVASKKIADGMYPDGGGLYLQVKNNGRSWLLRYMLASRQRYMGLGPAADISLSEARDLAADARKKIAKGADPIDQRRAAREQARIEAASAVTFEAATKSFLRFKSAEWTNKKHVAQWEATLATYAFPIIGKLPVRSIDTNMVRKVLEPIWTEKTETATRVRQRIEAVLDSAFAPMNPRPDNPARWKGHLDKLLPQPKKVKKTEHFEALDYDELPEFFGMLRQREAVSAKALAFTILTAARTSEVRHARLEEVNVKQSVWVVPPERMKAGREHRVPLTKEALALLPTDRNTGLLFPNAGGEALSDAAMRKYLQEDMERHGLTVHGFRSTFRQWVKDRTNVPGEIAEAALAHVNGDKTEAAYDRSDALERRRRLMQMWSRFCVAGAPANGRVIPMREAVNA